MLEKLKQLQCEADSIRAELGIVPPGTVTYLAPLNSLSDKTIAIESDGYGGATLMLAEGNYPFDFLTAFEQWFPSEEEASIAAERLQKRGRILEM